MWTRQNGVAECRNGAAGVVGKQAGRVSLFLAVLLLPALGIGCKKSAPAPSLLPPPPPETIARIRWLGKQRIAADTNAASAMAIWDLAESKNIEGLMLDRMAGGLLTTNGAAAITNQFSPPVLQRTNTSRPTPATNYQSRLTGSPALLRPLLEDLLEQECFVELRQVTNQPGDLVLAIRLNAERARLWETNLASVLESVTGGHAATGPGQTNGGWELLVPGHGPQAARRITLTRVGEWTVMGAGQPTNAVASEVQDLIQRTGMPFPRQPKEFWLYAEFDLRRVASALSLGWDLPAEFPRVTLGINGDGQTVRTRGQFDFPKALPADLGQWNIPTNLIHDPLISFTAIRGIASWLSSLKPWQDLFSGAPPSQVYSWAENGLPFLSFCAARLPNASNQVSQLEARLMQKANVWLATNSQGSFGPMTNGYGVAWKDLPLVEPFLEAMPASADDLVYGGLVREISSNRPPAALFTQITGPTNLVAYDWEMTGTRASQLLYFGQFFRMFLLRAQLPAKSASVAWFSAIEFKLGNCGTAVTRTGPAQLSLSRRSTIGFNALELHLLADWFESPKFPHGLNTLVGEPGPAPGHTRSLHPGRAARTNSVPAVKPQHP